MIWLFCRYTISCALFAFIIYDLLVTCKNSSKQNATVNDKYTKLAGFLIVLWIAYPIVWALCEGQELISVDAEVCLNIESSASHVHIR